MAKPFYITTTLPYVNSDPHIGHAMEFIRADVVARYKRLEGREVFFNTGTDEHGAKLYEAAQKQGIAPQEYVDGYAARFKELVSTLNISANNFIRTTDAHHIAAAQEFWRRADANGDIYKKNYQTKYCIGCELEKTDSELVEGKCAIHPNRDIEIRDEENYFFRYSKYGEKLLALYQERPDFVLPESRLNEMRAFIERGLEDFSISRLASKMPWGIPVPGDETHVMYVWFDALVNYVAAVGWPHDMESFQKWWNESGGVVQYCGKDNTRQQSAMWQAMLMSVGIVPSQKIIVNGFIMGADGQKMSKSIGNVVNPFDLIEEFKEVAYAPEEVIRFVVTHDFSSFEDSPASREYIRGSYSSQLANGIGNLTSRIMKLSATHITEPFHEQANHFAAPYKEAFEKYDLREAISYCMQQVKRLDTRIQETEPFKVVKVEPEKGKALITALVYDLAILARHLEPFLPKTSAQILVCIKTNTVPRKASF
jgi:methionyl-tRNA synthetase